ncbi:MAG: NADH dehydrogenase subunit 6 [Dehalococcoidia bacterium]
MAEKWKREIEEILKDTGDIAPRDTETGFIESEIPNFRKGPGGLNIHSTKVISSRYLFFTILGLIVIALLVGVRFIGLVGFLLLVGVAVVAISYLIIRARRPSPAAHKTPTSSSADPRKNPPQETPSS